MNDRQNEEIEIDDGVNVEEDLDEDLDEDDEERGVVGNEEEIGVEHDEARGDRATADEDVEDEETMKGR